MIKKYLSMIVVLLLLLSCTGGNYSSYSVTLIAHAGGAVGGETMTNSLEALHAAHNNGYRYIELDLNFTSDSILVAVHDWAEYNESMGMEERGDSAPTLAFFMSNPLPSGHTPLSADGINQFFLTYDNLHFVTDKISDPDVLERFFPDLKERMVVEAFNYDHYSALIDRGFEYVTYSCMAEDIPSATMKHIVFSWLFPGKKIERLALHTSAFDYLYMKFLLSISEFEISLFTVNNLYEIPEAASQGLKFIYTDSMLP